MRSSTAPRSSVSSTPVTAILRLSRAKRLGPLGLPFFALFAGDFAGDLAGSTFSVGTFSVGSTFSALSSALSGSLRASNTCGSHVVGLCVGGWLLAPKKDSAPTSRRAASVLAPRPVSRTPSSRGSASTLGLGPGDSTAPTDTAPVCTSFRSLRFAGGSLSTSTALLVSLPVMCRFPLCAGFSSSLSTISMSSALGWLLAASFGLLPPKKKDRMSFGILTRLTFLKSLLRLVCPLVLAQIRPQSLPHMNTPLLCARKARNLQ
mmetsp:Transcript_2276/g.4831  ORF Transcript_2276/g.4831 Transcript_2276/m.4831 type:complete len:262 (-) Transcript_2276:3-788(-)